MKAEKGTLQFAFRKAAARDLPAISDLYDKAFAQFVDTRYTRGYFSDALQDTDNQELIVATDKDDNVAGFLLLGAKSAMVAKGLNVDVVAVDEKYRGQGLGRKLMKEAEDIALRYDFNAMTLQVHEDNVGAIGLYESMGYDIVSKANKYYKDGKAAFGMHKSLTPPEAPSWMPGKVIHNKTQWS